MSVSRRGIINGKAVIWATQVRLFVGFGLVITITVE